MNISRYLTQQQHPDKPILAISYVLCGGKTSKRASVGFFFSTFCFFFVVFCFFYCSSLTALFNSHSAIYQLKLRDVFRLAIEYSFNFTDQRRGHWGNKSAARFISEKCTEYAISNEWFSLNGITQPNMRSM